MYGYEYAVVFSKSRHYFLFNNFLPLVAKLENFRCGRELHGNYGLKPLNNQIRGLGKILV